MTDQTQLDFIEDLNTLNQIAAALNRTVNIEDALNEALAQLVDLMGMKTGWIFLREPEDDGKWSGKGYRLAAHYNLPPALDVTNPEAWNKGCDCQGYCNKGKLNEAYNEVNCSRLATVQGEKMGLRVHASTPLKSGEQALGILNVAASDWQSFTSHALAMLSNVGSQMGVALERSRLYGLLQEQRMVEQATLLKLSNQLLALGDLEDVMAYLTAEVRRLLQVDACAILLLGADDPEYLYFQAASGWRSQPVANQYRVPADARSGSGKVMRTQEPLVVEDATMPEDSEKKLPMMASWLKEEGFQSAAIVPLLANGRSIGSMVVDTRQPRRFEADDVRLMQLLANQAALAIEKARLHEEEIQRHRMEEELSVGRQIQLSMLPPRCPELPGWDITAVYEAARQVGGDFYDFFDLPGEPRRLGLVIADVSDKGVPAALFMAMCRTTIRNNALRGRDPAEALTWANQFIQEDSHQTDMFLTAFYAALDTQTGQLRFANAGHNHPLWWRVQDQSCRRLQADGIVLGVLDEITLEECEIVVAPGDVLVLYTDGVTEAFNTAYEEFGEARLRTTVTNLLRTQPDASADQIARAIVRVVKTFMGGMPQFDDFTLFVVRRLATVEA